MSFEPAQLEEELLRVHRHAWVRLLLQSSLEASARSQSCVWYPPSCGSLEDVRLQHEIRAALRLAHADGLCPPPVLQACLHEQPPALSLIEAAEALLPGVGTLFCRGMARWSSLDAGWGARPMGLVGPGASALQWLESSALLSAREGAVEAALRRFGLALQTGDAGLRIQALAYALDAGSPEHIARWSRLLDGSQHEQQLQARLLGVLRDRRRSRRTPLEWLDGECPLPARELALALE
ncbi:MAG: hypothetical protein RL277_2515 [Planctomycetota bacterium]